MLKKVLHVSMVVVLLLAGTGAFAEQAEARGQGRKIREQVRERVYGEVYRQKSSVREKVYGQIYSREKVTERVYSQRVIARQRAAQVRENRQTIKELNRTVKEEMAVVRELIRELRKNPDLFTKEMEAAVKERLLLIRENRQRFAETIGDINEQRDKMRGNRRQKNNPGVRGNVDQILAVQGARIAILGEMVEDIAALRKFLQAPLP
ncbi:MAG: hypothetical protein M1571_05585 [Firmicutes bacterium]|nr:hypothetical protein [Bacillota bacterium]